VSADEDFTPNPLVAEELERVNQVWQNLVENINERPNRDRVSTILVQVMIEYYIDRILIIHNIGLPEEIYRMRYSTTLERLRGLNLIDEHLEHDLFDVIYQIRNIYAHEIDVDEDRVLNLINAVQTVRDPARFPEETRVENITQIILRQIQRVFMDTLVREQERGEDNPENS